MKLKNNDTELLDWLENNCGGYVVISDDNGHWACTNSGSQSLSVGDADDMHATFFIEKSEWKNTVREAIIEAMYN